MELYRLRLEPLSPWVTPWQADTLAGRLCAVAATLYGGEWLRERILEPALRGQPPFVLSDACPGDLLPAPISLRLHDWPAADRKRVRRTAWLSTRTFQQVQAGRIPAANELPDLSPFVSDSHVRNTLDRMTQTTGDSGSLFSIPEHSLREGLNQLTIYLRVTAEFQSSLLELFQGLAADGFGADCSVGRGQFRIASGLEPATWLDDVSQPNGVVCLSTFQPAPSDPTDGYWESFTKFGKLGPELGLRNVFKRPLVLLRPGACFRASHQTGFVGRAIPPDDFLPTPVAAELQSRNIHPLHLTFAVTVPAKLHLFANIGEDR